MPWNWTQPLSDDLWRDALKTLFDPCPAGWRVPLGASSPWNAFYAENRGYVSGYWDPESLGARWAAPAVSGGSVWYPAAGLRSRDFGSLNDTGIRGLYLTTTAGTTPPYFNIEMKRAYINTAYRSYGFSVRCIRE